MANWFSRLSKNKNAGLIHQPGKQRLTLAEIATTGGSQRIRDISNALWFPAGQPVPPVAPKGTPPRRTAYQPLRNINWTGREGGLGFTELRRFANYTLSRAIIESVLDRLCSETWDFRLKQEPDEKKKDYKKRNSSDPRLKALREVFRKPDGWQSFRVWSRGLYDDMLVADAASIWLQRDNRNRIASLVQIDGALVFPLVDETGQQPDVGRKLVQTSNKKAERSYINKITAHGGVIKKENDQTSVRGGSPAFQLTPYGYPAQEMTADELIYAVRNRKTYRMYGFPIVEQAVAIIALGLARQDFQAAYYQSGNVPEFIAFLPPDVTPSKAEELNGYLDSILTGQLGNRRKGFFLPSYGSEKTPNIVFPKANDEVLKDMFDEWLARVLCFFFGMTPTAFIKGVNRATSEQMSEDSEEQGLEPYKGWFKDLLDDVVQEKYGFDDIEAVSASRKEQDGLKQAEIDDKRLRNGSKTLNEIREENGEDRYTITEADMPCIVTATGVVAWDGSPLSNAPPPPDPVAPANGSPAPPNGKKPPPKGKQPPKAKKADSSSDDSRHNWPTLSPGILSTKSHSARVRTEVALNKCFRAAKAAAIRGVNGLVARPAEKALADMLENVRKDLPEDDDYIDSMGSELWYHVESHFSPLASELATPFEQSALSGVQQAAVQMEIDDVDLLNSINYQAAEVARERAAELVGMKRDIEGNLVPNPDAKWAITETTRQDLRDTVKRAFEKETDWEAFKAELKADLQNSNTFSHSRAAMIARTEIGRAQGGAMWDVWKKSGMASKLRWEAVGADPCPECLMNDQQEVDFGEPFPSGAYSTLDSHPRCSCLVRVVEFEE